MKERVQQIKKVKISTELPGGVANAGKAYHANYPVKRQIIRTGTCAAGKGKTRYGGGIGKFGKRNVQVPSKPSTPPGESRE